MRELAKAYDPKQYEDAIYKRWEKSGFFDPDQCVKKKVAKKTAKPFSVVLPPPNVTGTLHIGHAVMLAVEDLMVRYHRMMGDRTLWVPGTDHAAIATQSKVEKILYETEGKTRHDIGREAFLKRVEKFAAQSHDTIVNQAKKMGASLDWSREAFTLDEKRNFAVRTMFKNMYDDGLIYRGHRIVNWDPKLQTTVSDDEVIRKEETGIFYYLQYGPFVIGTARPETKFGDKYVVMHPDDARYKQYRHGQVIDVEWMSGPVKATIIKDNAVDMQFGTGVMTITPWHDETDFYIAERHNLAKEQIIDYQGKLLPIAGEFAGLDITEGRKRLVEKLKAKGLLVRTDEKYVHSLALNSRGEGIIEPQIMEQWFVDVQAKFPMRDSHVKGIRKGQMVSLKQLMHLAVKNGQITLLPDRFYKTYFHWIDNLRDWCISRQLWYGHRIPAWYRGKEVYVGITAPKGDGWRQDPDTLDTWFSSGLWTFSTLGWPKKTKDVETYHPTSVLETGYDILFFWVARMILMSTYALGTVPFHTVYLHGLVRDEQGRKMSKSLGNIIDPLDMIQRYGTDATRLSLLIGGTPGNDVRLSEEKIGGFRNFTNKLWNIARFMLLHIERPKIDLRRPKAKTLADAWILARMDAVVREVTLQIEKYNFSLAGEVLRDFTWGDMADWYLEIAKVEGKKSAILNYLLNTILKLWHPFMPFVTEALWGEMYGSRALLLTGRWPAAKGALARAAVQRDFAAVRSLVTRLRAIRAEYHVEPSVWLRVSASAGRLAPLLQKQKKVVMALARLGEFEVKKKLEKPSNAIGFVDGGVETFVDLAGMVDREKERQRLKKEIDDLVAYVASLEQKLANAQFVQHAPAAIVEGERRKLAAGREKLEKLRGQYANT